MPHLFDVVDEDGKPIPPPPPPPEEPVDEATSIENPLAYIGKSMKLNSWASYTNDECLFLLIFTDYDQRLNWLPSKIWQFVLTWYAIDNV